MLRPLLSPLTYVCLYILLGIPQAQCQVKLGMMLDAFDDQYIGCEKEMDGLAPGLLRDETSKPSPFTTAWEKSDNHWKTVKRNLKLPQSFKDEHGRAIIVSTDRDFYGTFAMEERKAWTSPADYRAKFQFKALHYYLTRALQLLRGSCDEMYKKTVYQGTNISHTGSGIMRFGLFASSSFKSTVAKTFGTETLFTIHTCFGVDISNFSYAPTQEEVLIPVHEQFKASPGQDSHSFVLHSTKQTCSYFNCALLNGTKDSVCVDNSATRGEIAFSSQMSPSLFGGSIILIHVAALKLFASF